jgi:hypothetical protein
MSTKQSPNLVGFFIMVHMGMDVRLCITNDGNLVAADGTLTILCIPHFL